MLNFTFDYQETTVRQHLSNLLHSTGRLSEAGRCLAEMHWSTQEGTPLKLKLLVTAIGESLTFLYSVINGELFLQNCS